MRLTVLGRSPAYPNPGEACAGYLVEGGTTRLLVDIGPGVVSQLLRLHHPDELSAIVISHMHTDHMLDLVTLRYVMPWRSRPREERLQVILPPGSANQLLDLARGAGNARHFEDTFRLSEHDGSTPLDFDGLTLTPVETKHFVPCWGFRVEADGRLLAYSADSAPCGGVLDLAEKADLFLCEATLRSLDEDAQPPEPRGHLLPAEAGEAARTAGAKRLLLTHLPVEDGAAGSRSAAGETFGSAVEVAEPLADYDV
ncbi:MAG: MBL fold metallo-hydrolase [Candidatus Limnocylindria bacterium]